MGKMKKLALVDFDNTIVMCDTLGYIFRRERYYLDVRFLIAGSRVFIVRVLFPNQREKQIYARNTFKRILLSKFCRMDEVKLRSYVNYFRTKLNNKLLEFLGKQLYDRIVVVSASEEGLIKGVLNGVFPFDMVVSNSCSGVGENFETCWNVNKLKFLRKVITIEEYECIHLYTDSYDDLPLMEIADETFMVKGGEITKL